MTVTSMYRDNDRTGSVVVEEVFSTDPADLWQALTDPDRLRRWILATDPQLTRNTPGVDTCGRPSRRAWRP